MVCEQDLLGPKLLSNALAGRWHHKSDKAVWNRNEESVMQTSSIALPVVVVMNQKSVQSPEQWTTQAETCQLLL